MRLSVILPTVRPWPEVEAPLTTSLRQHCGEPFEVLVLDGHGEGLAREPEPPVRWIRRPGADVFELRALGAAAARGELIIFSEDHCLAPADWLARTSAAHREHAAVVLIGPVLNHADSSHRAVDRANFALTLGQVTPPLTTVARGRLPVPTNLSIKRAALPVEAPASGWLEYDFLADAFHNGRLAVAEDAVLHHRQSWNVLEVLVVHFHSGRSYGAAVRQWPRGRRREWWRAVPRVPGHLYRITAPVLQRSAAGARSSMVDHAWLLALVLANVVGQMIGACGGPGSSRRYL